MGTTDGMSVDNEKISVVGTYTEKPVPVNKIE